MVYPVTLLACSFIDGLCLILLTFWDVHIIVNILFQGSVRNACEPG